MSQIQNATPTTPPGAPPPRMPSTWLDPLVVDPPSLPVPPGDDCEEVVIIDDAGAAAPAPARQGWAGRGRLPYGRAYVKSPPGAPEPAKPAAPSEVMQQRLLILDTWMRSGLPAGDYAPLVGVSKHTLYAWKARFEEDGPAGLMDRQRGGPKGSRLSETTKRAILMMKQSHPDWGIDRLSDLLLRTHALAASPPAVARVLQEAGYEVQEGPQVRHAPQSKPFEKPCPSDLWQTDLFTFILKRQNQRVYLVAFMDDHSRFIVSYGLHASQSGALVLETLRAGISSFGTPRAIYTDNGTQYVTWRGKSRFSEECKKRGIEHIVAAPRHPQSLGKIERFWGSLWRECVEQAVFTDLGEARIRIGHYIDHYNYQRPHQGIGGMMPADRFFRATPTVLETLRSQVAANALELARQGVPKPPFYLAGALDGRPFSLRSEGERMILDRDGRRSEIDFDPRQETALPPAAATAAASQPAPQAGAADQPPPILPAPVCATAQISSAWTGAEEQPPGGSALDAQPPLDFGPAEAAAAADTPEIATPTLAATEAAAQP